MVGVGQPLRAFNCDFCARQFFQHLPRCSGVAVDIKMLAISHRLNPQGMCMTLSHPINSVSRARNCIYTDSKVNAVRNGCNLTWYNNLIIYI